MRKEFVFIFLLCSYISPNHFFPFKDKLLQRIAFSHVSTSSSSQSTAICLWLYHLPDIQSLNSVIPFVIQDFFCFSAAFNIIIYYCLEIPSPWILWHTWLWSSLSDYCLSYIWLLSLHIHSCWTFSVYQSSIFCLLFSCNIFSWVIS